MFALFALLWSLALFWPLLELVLFGPFVQFAIFQHVFHKIIHRFDFFTNIIHYLNIGRPTMMLKRRAQIFQELK
jgi:hypothetical protein